MKPTTRRMLTQLGLYLLFIVIVVAVAMFANWPQLRANFWGDGLSANWHQLITVGVRQTLIYTGIAFVFGLLLAMVLALLKLSPVWLYRWSATGFIEFFRGLPALLVMLAFAFGVPIAFPGFQWPGGPIGGGLCGLVLVSGAYMAETLRAGLQAVPKGQIEAARSLGMSPVQTMVSVTLPQAIRIVIPPLTNEVVLLIKDTALLFVVGMQASQRELTTLSRGLTQSGATAGTSTSYVQAALLYLAITLPLTQIVAWLERRQQRSK